uniref:Toll like receptor 2 n=1 Tax=Lates calcarifer TaxID=8187 RepID=A0A4W6EQ14_LATCA
VCAVKNAYILVKQKKQPQCHSCEQTSCNCSRQNLSNVPSVPSKLITELDISFNRLKTIMNDDFLAYVNLRSLIMTNSKIKTIQEQAFVPLINLEKLDLSVNELETLSAEWFKKLLSLQYLNLWGNKYKTLGQGNLFQPLKKLKTLHIGGPFLQSVRESDFSGLSGLEELFFDGKNLQDYAEGSLRKPGPISQVTVVLNNLFWRRQTLDQVLLSDVAHPNTRLTFTDTWFIFEFDYIRHLEVVVLKNVDTPQFYSFPALSFMGPVLKVGRRVSVINSKLFAIPCETSTHLLKLEYMDISDNLFSDLALTEMMCDGKGVLWSLQTINVSRNHLRSINSQLFTKLEKLQNIDMSGNMFHKVTSCLPESLYILDLSDNKLTVFNIELPFLTDLYISGNKISSLPDGGLYPRLVSIYIQKNDLQTFRSDNLNDYNNLKSLKAAANTYIFRIEDELKLYICDSPDAVRGKSVSDARLSVFECHTALSFSLLCSAILVMFLLVAGLCHKFSIVWYMKMTWAWLRAKRKPKLKKGELEYDAFVSYSEMDSGWVEAHLVPELEQSEPPLQLCLHKRDFVPGGWIMDNIMDAIEKSHKTLFILSQHFVRSEWCKYELDFTHFRLFDQNNDAVVLILLEPIDKNTIPRKFCKLRRVMNSRTYLEWPDDENQINRFWQSLRTAIKRPVTDNLLNSTTNLVI